MKLTIFFQLFALLLVCTPARSQRVSISGKDLSLEEIFMEIKKQTGFEFIYPSALLKAAKPVTLKVKKMPVADVLKICLEGQGLGFNIRNGVVVIFKEDDPKTERRSIEAPAPAINTVLVSGQVVDEQGQPVEMASVVLLRTHTGVLTNRSGIFSLKLNEVLATDSLNISFVGLKSCRVRLGGKTDLGEIVMQASDNMLDEAMVIAYGTSSERFRTGDIVTVKAAEIEHTPSLNVIEALAGRVPGLYIRQNGSNPSSVFSIQLRGANVMPQTESMARGDAVNMLSKPLIVVDGLPMPQDVIDAVGSNKGVVISGLIGAGGGQDALYWLNTLDVESITVLKDAEATVLYGSRAANGVIIITTKKGKAAKTSLSITANTGVNMQARRMDLMNTQQYLAMRREAWDNTKKAGLLVQSLLSVSDTPDIYNSYDLLLWDTTRYTDWQKELLGSAPVYNFHLGLTGGEGRTAYRVAAGYNRSKTSYPNMPGTPGFKEEKGTLLLNLTTRSANNRLKLVTSVISAITGSLQPRNNPDAFTTLVPDAPAIFDAAGNLNFAEWRAVLPIPNFLTAHPLSFLAIPYQDRRFNMLANTSVSYEVLRSLVFTIGAGYLRSEGKQSIKAFGSAIDAQMVPISRSAIFGNTTGINFNFEPNLRYELRWRRHYLDAFAGASYQSDKQEGGSIAASGYSSDELMSSPAGATSLNYSNNYLQRKSVSVLARLSYRYANQYLVDLSARRDGSSSFGPGRRFGNFGSVGLGWIFSEAGWFKNVPLITFGKIRGSYGLTGNQNANPYAYLPAFSPTPSYGIFLPSTNWWYSSDGTYQDVPTLALARAANSTLNWAKAVSLDLGIDLYLLPDQRLKLSTEWYRKRTGNQLVVNTVSVVTGVPSYLVNSPVKVENSGVEVVVDYTSPQRSTGFNWYAQFNIAINNNKLLSFPGLENSPLKRYYEVGQPIIWQQVYRSYLDKTLGVYQITDADHPAPDFYRVNNYPAFTGGLQAGTSWKGISLSISCTFAKQKGFTNIQGTQEPGTLLGFGNSNQPVSITADRHWKSPADVGLGGALYAKPLSNPWMDIYWGNASYLAIKNATLNYALPQALLKQIGIAGLNLYIRAENLLLLALSGYKGLNPEQPDLTAQLPLRRILVSGFTMNL